LAETLPEGVPNMPKKGLQCPNCHSNNVIVRGKRIMIKGLIMVTGILTALFFLLGFSVFPVLTTAALYVWLGGLLLIGAVLVLPNERIEMFYCRSCEFRWLRGQFDEPRR
jgi:hypothetical protein